MAALSFSLLLLSSLSILAARESMKEMETLRDGEMLVSDQFVLGFFSPGSSNAKRYLGIWYTFSNMTIVWVANRKTPIADSTGNLRFTADGNLVLTHNNNITVWSSGTTALKPILHLSKKGNLIINDDVSGAHAIWQSFDYPTDTMLPGMKLGLDFKKGLRWVLTSWKSSDDPSPGDTIYSMEPNGLHEIYVWHGDVAAYRLGPWNGLRFSGIPRMNSSSYRDTLLFNFVNGTDEAYYTFEPKEAGTTSRLWVISGKVHRAVWATQMGGWSEFWEAPGDGCDQYARCGANGFCDLTTAVICRCFVGYVPANPVKWQLMDWKDGCVRKEKELCGVGEGFRLVPGVKLPDTENSTVISEISLDKCREMCLGNCSCTAYAAANIFGHGCITWTTDLIDTRYVAEGQQLYVRVSSKDATSSDDPKKRKKKNVAVAIILVFLGATLVSLCGLLIWLKSRRRTNKSERHPGGMRMSDIDGNSTDLLDNDLQLFDFPTIAFMTEEFSNKNKIGEGGFGSVYKGITGDGRTVALKRRSRASDQGLNEFMNEAVLIARLQHRNLVRLLGCCIDGEERILVYEFMQNKSLDSFIFDRDKRPMLVWKKRIDIIVGIARGLLYLHEDSRVRIIHRDLKASNILLDEGMVPKISDFGTARIFGANQMESNTRRVIGTYGYMSPEYAMDGIFSVKSDVFSFGVLLLEIISGRKNRVLDQEEQDVNLSAMAWRLWTDGQELELLDETITSSCSILEVKRCIKIGLLCVQECAVDRPTMSAVVLMLSNEASPLPEPKRPGFCRRGSMNASRDSPSYPSGQVSSSANTLTCTEIQGR